MKIRAATLEDAEAIAQVHVAAWQSAYRDILPADLLAGLSVERRTANWKAMLAQTESNNFTLVAEDDTRKVVGFSQCGPQRDETLAFQGELYAVYLLPSAQGQGAGRELLLRSAHWLHEHGCADMLIWVLRDNHPARAFYERMGGKYVREKPIQIGEQTYIEVAYGWKDIKNMPSA